MSQSAIALPRPTLTLPHVRSWPLEGVGADGSVRWARDDDSIRESLLNILLTRPGERLQRPDFGAGLLNFVHEPNNETTRHLMAGVIRKSLQLWEPRIVIEQVSVSPSPQHPADVHLHIRYRMKHLNQSDELGLTLSLGVSR
ncbi:GPW/gp25 family protein [Marinibactrum halimedae]|uniref:IraD/Gp25-like domain-containing protein n=1 Tax=Marinibactrum halimedae TaxID=1444977 RepID=A0AA37T6F7_9GAMM|nr:GPW/gp25 family protein [Marinibactrum halimedae]MCD9460624.1 GPW/gp25 family protein [Marinibactrum halimedae]GLS27840.1 hypothetical protein GCM10007877_35590 [Marinibactrum halimedae]